jgi:hypothetical protein
MPAATTGKLLNQQPHVITSANTNGTATFRAGKIQKQLFNGGKVANRQGGGSAMAGE